MALGLKMKNSSINNISLRWDDFQWIGDFEFPPFTNDIIEINVGAEDEEVCEPHEEQIKALTALLHDSKVIYQEVLNSIFKYYIRIRPQYEAAGQDCIENMPVLENSSQLESMITLNHITISWPYEKADAQIGLSYSCIWDVEHGLGLVLTSNKITDVGSADCAII